MQLGFDTDEMRHAKAALLLYAMYKSRDKASALNGLETWNRFTSFIRGAMLKSTTTAEFCNNFCKMAKIGSIKPYYLTTDGGIVEMPDGTLIQSSDVKDYKLEIMEDNSLMPIFESEGQYITMLIRERIQRDKLNQEDEYENQD